MQMYSFEMDDSWTKHLKTMPEGELNLMLLDEMNQSLESLDA